jgi:hypothetical protein
MSGRPLLLGYDAKKRRVRIDPDDRKTHMHVLGSSGSRKCVSGVDDPRRPEKPTRFLPD